MPDRPRASRNKVPIVFDPVQARASLVELYRKMSEMTAPECANTCAVPYICCSPEYCDLTKEIAKDYWGIELQPTSHPRLPYMGPAGCIVAPHLRPLCTVHTCDINSLGFKKNDPQWTRRYFKLRNQIDQIENKLFTAVQT